MNFDHVLLYHKKEVITRWSVSCTYVVSSFIINEIWNTDHLLLRHKAPVRSTRVLFSGSSTDRYTFTYMTSLFCSVQLSASLGVRVRDVGVVKCHEVTIPLPDAVEGKRCVGGCWVGLAEDFTVVDANSSAVVGPRVVMRGRCGCPTQTTVISTPTRALPCSPNTCLNGGRCLSTSSGTRWVWQGCRVMWTNRRSAREV